MPIQLSRDEFLADYFDYRPGEHLSAIEPTGGGKTHLVYQCADVAMRQNPGLSFASLMPKSRSPSTEQWAARLRLRETPTWPPPSRMFWQAAPRGYVVWPRHRRDLGAAANREQVAGHLRKALDGQYWAGNSITFADDLHVTAALMGLNPELEQLWTAGREGGAGLWGANQKPSGTQGGGSVSSFMYSAVTHLFLGKDTDDRNIRRFGEIGAVDSREVESIVRSLQVREINGNPVSDKLYIDKRGPYLVVLTPW